MNKIPLIENACRELMEYGVPDRRDKCRELVKRLILHRKTAGEDFIFWPTGLLAAGLWHCREELVKSAAPSGTAGGIYGAEPREAAAAGQGAEPDFAGGPDADAWAARIDRSLAAYYGRWMKKDMPLAVLDDLLAGETLLDMYAEIQKGGTHGNARLSDCQIKAALDKMALYAAAHPVDVAGSLLYRPANGETAVFVDGIGLACPFLYRYGEVFDRQEYKELAVLQIVNFLSYGMDGKTGLPYHGYDMADGCKYGIIGWGRAVGWLLRGMMGCMVSAYGREKLRVPCIALVDAALACQRQDGCFSWQLEALEGPADTSAAGMVCAGLRQGLSLGVLAGETYENALAAGRRALERSVRDGLVYQCSGECEGFSRYPQRYGAYPWSLGPALTVL